MNHKARITIKDVAREAGVSTQTVSRVLNTRPDVSSATRQRVQKIIDRLGYRPSALARSLIHRRSLTLGVVTAGLKHIGPSRTLNGIAQQAELMGYALLLKELPRYEAMDAAQLLQSLLDRQVDGILWAVPEIGANRAWLADALQHLPVPVVFLTMRPKPGCTIISIDNYRGGCLAVQHLIDQGYQKIAHLAGPQEWLEAHERKRAWHDTLTQAGLPCDDRQVAVGNWSSASAEEAFYQLRDQFPAMDAVFAANDQMALSVLQAACRQAVRVPEDLGVVGFDGIPESEFFWPSLTTINQDQDRLGSLAVQKLVTAIENTVHNPQFLASDSIVIQPQLVMRQSTQKQTLPEIILLKEIQK